MSDLPPPFDALWFQILIGLLVGLCLGSFITMLSYRLPRKLSLSEPSRSFCPNCKTLLKPHDLVPVLSWVNTGGKCRYCALPVSMRYPLIEIVTGVLCALAFSTIGFQPKLILALIIIVVSETLIIAKIES
jgi:leader peptidase (prepilin peptidase)/N-methyltransferase